MSENYSTLGRCPNLIKICFAIFLFLIGGSIYVAFRTTTLTMFSWFDTLDLTPYISYARSAVSGFSIPDFLKYCFPDSCWLLSYLLIIDAIYSSEISVLSLISFSLLPIVAVGSEILQAVHLIPGTFDINDMICYIGSVIIFVSLKYIKF